MQYRFPHPWPALSGIFIAVICCQANGAYGQADVPNQKVVNEAAGDDQRRLIGNEHSLAEAPVIELSFRRYIDKSLLQRAWADLDSASMLDAALLLAEAEQVLRRPHPPFTAEEAFTVSLRMAASQQDTETLQRLADAADRLQDDELKQRVARARKLAESTRTESSEPQFSLRELHVGQVSYLKDLLSGVDRASILGDSEAVEKWKEVTKDLELFDEQATNRITSFLDTQQDLIAQNAANGGGEADEALSKLVFPTRARITFDKLVCNEQEGIIFPDHPRLVILLNGTKPYSFSKTSMSTGDEWILDATFAYSSYVKVKLYDDDALDPDDFLGEATIRVGTGRTRVTFDRDPNGTGCKYTLYFSI